MEQRSGGCFQQETYNIPETGLNHFIIYFKIEPGVAINH